MTPTRYSELGYHNYSGTWRFCVAAKGYPVGPSYGSLGELLADMDRFAYQFGCQDAIEPVAPPSPPQVVRTSDSDCPNPNCGSHRPARTLHEANNSWCPACETQPAAKRVRTSDATNDIENAFKEWFYAAGWHTEEAKDAHNRVKAWLTHVAADQRQLHAALLACQAMVAAETDIDRWEAVRLAHVALETK